MIERRNILSLIGADSNKYHTCYITSYSFDFMFFEQRILPKLRRAGMVNINVFVDASMFEKQMAQLDGNFVYKQSYSITPIRINGAFHPKILMCLGKNNGMLAIGSGNLTHSGLSGNDEVWGAFHTYKSEGKAAPLFSQTYEYLLKLKSFSYGYNLKKWSWVMPNSKWLKDIENPSEQVINEKGEEVHLIGSFQDSSIYSELKSKLPTNKPQRISIISPYFNKDGRFLKQLLDAYEPNRMDVIIDGRFGTVPNLMENDSRIQFHQWHELKKDETKVSPRLHAKMIQFEYADSTYFFTGSSNATEEAFGNANEPSRNAEMNILIHSAEVRNYLEEMDILIPDKGLDDVSKVKTSPIEFESSSKYEKKCHINQVDKDLELISIYVDDDSRLPDNFNICIECADTPKPSFYSQKGPVSGKIELKISEGDATKGFRLFISDRDGQRISNYQRLHDLSRLERTNPDSKAKRLLDIISKEELHDDDLITLLEFANFEKAVSASDSSRGFTSGNNESDKQEAEKNYETVGEEEFNKKQSEIEEYHRSASSNLGLLENFLNDMVFAVPQKEDLSDDQEAAALEAGDEGIDDDDGNDGNDENLEKIILSFHDGQKIHRKLHNTLNNISLALSWKHSEILNNLIKYLEISTEVGIEDVKALLVGTHLLIIKDGKTYKEERVKIVVRYKDIESLELFEKKNKRLRLERLDKQQEGHKHLAYSADANLIDDIDENLITVEGVKLVYHDQTPSMEISHQYFTDSPVFNRGKQLNTTIKGYLINVVAPSLLSILNGQAKLREDDKTKYESFKYRLLLRILALSSMVYWSRNEEILLKLLILNSIYVLSTKEHNNTLIGDMNSLMAKLHVKISSNKIDVTIKGLVLNYAKWISVYDNDKTQLIEILARKNVGNVIFKSKIGFAVIQTLGSNSLNLMTPLGAYNSQSISFEIRNFKWGKKVIVFK